MLIVVRRPGAATTCVFLSPPTDLPPLGAHVVAEHTIVSCSANVFSPITVVPVPALAPVSIAFG